jgi:carbon monoxide dehydrogenase subunit G
MDFDNTFAVDAPIDEVWRTMLDVERVAPCVPGARVVARTGDDAFKVAIKVKLGPVSMTYTGDVEIAEADETQHRAVMRAKARESRGQGTADATVEMSLREEDGGTAGTIHSNVAISGKAAAMGQGVIGDVSARMIDTFATNLAAMLAGGDEPVAAAAEPRAAAGGESPPAGGAGAGESRAAAAASESRAAAAASEPRAPARESPADDGLPVLDIVGSVLAERLRDPRVLGGTLAGAALVGYLVGRRGR